MLKCTIVATFLSFFVGGHIVMASPICDTIQECSDVIMAARVRLRDLSNGTGWRSSIAGAIFTRDNSIPGLGEAYKDPSGLIWGSARKLRGSYLMNYSDAVRMCKENGARLPSKEEFVVLARRLGVDTAIGYYPFLDDGKTDLLPGISNQWFWSSSTYKHNWAVIFNGSAGYVGDRHTEGLAAVRCVAGR